MTQRYAQPCCLLLSAALLFVSGCSREERETEKVENLKRMVREQADRLLVTSGKHVEEIEEWSRERLMSFLSNLAAYKPVLDEAGFAIDNIRVKAGLIPSATLCCSRVRKLRPVERAELLEKYDQERMKRLILTLLYKAYEIEIPGYTVASIWITISAAPHSVVIFDAAGPAGGE